MEALDAACALLGSQQNLAAALTLISPRLTSPSISDWRNRAVVPDDRCEPIETATAGAVTVEELRPDLRWRRDAAGQVVGCEKQIKPTPRPRKRAGKRAPLGPRNRTQPRDVAG